MSLTLELVPYGREATCRLRDAIADVQCDDPLAPVTVLVTRNVTGLGVRRLLASGDLGPAPSTGRTGLVNVHFTTLARLAHDLAGAVDDDGALVPATPAVLHAVARAAFDHLPDGLLSSVKDHPGTLRALVAAHRDLGGVPELTRGRLAGTSRRAGEVVAAVEEMERLLRQNWMDERASIDRAIGVLASAGGARFDRAPVIMHLPSRLSGPDEELVRALADVVPVRVLVGVTGDNAADSTARETAARLSAGHQFDDLAARSPAPPDTPSATSVISAPTADTEVLAVLRLVTEQRRRGTRFERMAIVHGGVGPYQRQITEALDAAGIPFASVAQRQLAATVPGRMLAGLFDLNERGWRRDEVVAWLTSTPVLDAGRPVPATEWDWLSRQAGVTAGVESWQRQLGRLAEAHTEKLAAAEGAGGAGLSPARLGRLRCERTLMASLATFIAELTTCFDDPPTSWAGWTAWASDLLDRYLGRPSQHRDPWPSAEEEALNALRVGLQSLAILDRLGQRVDRSRFRQALDLELSAPAPQTSKFGTGVLVGPVAILGGLDFDVVFVVGMVDGAFPPRERDDPLLPDEARRRAGPDVPLCGGGPHDAYRDYLAALAAAPERVLSYARGDQRRGGEQRPARWLLDSLAVLVGSGSRLFSRDVDQFVGHDRFRWIPSFTSAVEDDGEPVSLADRDLRSLLRWTEEGRDLGSCWLVKADDRLRSSLEARRSRLTKRLTRFDGAVGALLMQRFDTLPGVLSDSSPTGLEQYASCPRQHLMERILQVEVRDRPEDVLSMPSNERGVLIHRVLQRFVEHQVSLPRPLRIEPDSGWTAADHAHLDTVTDQAFAEVEATGAVGRHLLWELDRDVIRQDLHRFLDSDDAYRATGGWVPESVEWGFGAGHGPPVVLATAGGRSLGFHGFVDRIDRNADGGLSVIDYKTGSARRFRSITVDPLSRGVTLQLPIYGLAARSAAGAADGEGEAAAGAVPVQVSYWFVSGNGGFRREEYPLDDAVVHRLGEVVGTLVDGIEGGLFPARPGEDEANCTWCEYQPLCPGDRQDAWSRARNDPRLRSYVELAEGPDAGPAEA